VYPDLNIYCIMNKSYHREMCDLSRGTIIFLFILFLTVYSKVTNHYKLVSEIMCVFVCVCVWLERSVRPQCIV